MFCRKCGSLLPDHVKFCPDCGHPCRPEQEVFKHAKDAFSQAASEVDSAVREVEETFQSSGSGYGSNGDGHTSYSVEHARHLKDDRGLVSYLLLTFITCGIYSWFFLYSLAKDVNTACEGDGDNTPGLLVFILLSTVTCGFYTYYWDYKLGNRLYDNGPRYGLTFQENGTTVLLWGLIGLLVCGLGPLFAMYILIKNTNAICSAYNRSHGV